MRGMYAAQGGVTARRRSTMRPAWPRWCLLALVGLGFASRPAEPAPILTATLDRVATVSSHVGLFDWVPTTRRFRVVTWLRGTWPSSEIEVHGLSGLVSGYLSMAGEPVRLGSFDGETATPTGRVALFLEELDGRLHHTGMRRYGGIGGAHASVRFLTKEGTVLVLQQVMNPGGPVPVSAGSTSEKAFLEELRALLVSHPYAPPGPTRPAVPAAHRAAFFQALGRTIDWYQGDWPQSLPGWSGRVGSAEEIVAAADRLRTWMLAVEPEDRLVGMDALLLLARIVQGGGPDASRAIAVAHEMLPSLDASAAKAWILSEIEHGDYYTNRTALARLAKALGPSAYEDALARLEAWVERTDVNEGTAAWWALVGLGHQDRADAAKARREAREAKTREGGR